MADDTTRGASTEPTSKPKIWGRRPYAGKEAREVLNDVSRWIHTERPDSVADPDDPTLADCLRHASAARRDAGPCPKGATLRELVRSGMTFQQAVVWYWFRYCSYDITEIHYAITGNDTGGDPSTRRKSTRRILATLRDAADHAPDATRDDIPDLIDDRQRHDRTDIEANDDTDDTGDTNL